LFFETAISFLVRTTAVLTHYAYIFVEDAEKNTQNILTKLYL